MTSAPIIYLSGQKRYQGAGALSVYGTNLCESSRRSNGTKCAVDLCRWSLHMGRVRVLFGGYLPHTETTSEGTSKTMDSQGGGRTQDESLLTHCFSFLLSWKGALFSCISKSKSSGLEFIISRLVLPVLFAKCTKTLTAFTFPNSHQSLRKQWLLPTIVHRLALSSARRHTSIRS